MEKRKRRYPAAALRGLALCLPCLLALSGCGAAAAAPQPDTAATFAMDTLVTQEGYGAGAREALQKVNETLAAYENRLSMFLPGSDIAAVNAAAGGAAVEVEAGTAALLRQALALCPRAEGAFALSVGPLTRAWGVTTDAPRVPGAEELAALLPLVDDGAIRVEGRAVRLEKEGMALDLGGIAKGAACALAGDIYREYGVSGALLSIGGNVYACGVKPGGRRFRVAFRDPARAEGAYIASIEMEDEVLAVSGGYERYFERDGKRYIHIIDPRTGRPAESDIVSVGVVCADGAEADFWSTTLFVWGREKTLAHMRGGARVMMLDDAGVLYVSEGLRASFETHAAGEYRVVFVAEEAV